LKMHSKRIPRPADAGLQGARYENGKVLPTSSNAELKMINGPGEIIPQGQEFHRAGK
jgi:hypothetical protein